MRLRNVKGAREDLAASEIVFLEEEILDAPPVWDEVFANGKPVSVEIGCGKGRFIQGMAKAFPETNFIGVEKFSSVLIRALQRLETEDEAPDNVRLIRMDAENIEVIFGKGSVKDIYLNFSDPWPKDRHAKRRLTSVQYLKRYEKILSDEGKVIFKTDNKDLFDFSVEQAKEAGWNIEDIQTDLTASGLFNIQTEYEERFAGMGKNIYRMIISKKVD